MVEERVYVQRGPSAAGLFLGLLIVVAIVVGVLWGTGALTVGRDAQDRVQVTLDPARAEDASSNALDKTGKALENAGAKIQQQAHKPNRQEPVQR